MSNLRVFYVVVEEIIHRGQSVYSISPPSKFTAKTEAVISRKQLTMKFKEYESLPKCEIHYGDIIGVLADRNYNVKILQSIYVKTFSHEIDNKFIERHFDLNRFCSTYKIKEPSLNVWVLDNQLSRSGRYFSYVSRRHRDILNKWYEHRILRALKGICLIDSKYNEIIDCLASTSNRETPKMDILKIREEAIKAPYLIPFISEERFVILSKSTGNYITSVEAKIHSILRNLWKILWVYGKIAITESQLDRIVKDYKSRLAELGAIIPVIIRGNKLWTLPIIANINNITVDCARAIVERRRFRQIDLSFIDHLRLEKFVDIEKIEWALSRPISCITGAAGTGKTTVLVAILECAMLLGLRVLVSSFTANAVKRAETLIAESDVITSSHNIPTTSTIHYAMMNKMKYDLVIIDEMSMVGIGLLHSALSWITSSSNPCQLILIGDPNQLQPVGCGDTFDRLIKSTPTLRLKEVHRVDNDEIIKFSNLVVRTDLEPSIKSGALTRMLRGKFERLEIKELPSNSIVEEAANRYISSQEDTVIISMTNKEVNLINDRILQKLNKDILSPGTRIVITRNVRGEHSVFNGEIGEVVERTDSGITVILGGEYHLAKFFPKSKDELSTNDISPAYAMTVHKSQGSEWPNVIVAINTSISQMKVSRRLFYTAITRTSNKLSILTNSISDIVKHVNRRDKIDPIPLATFKFE